MSIFSFFKSKAGRNLRRAELELENLNLRRDLGRSEDDVTRLQRVIDRLEIELSDAKEKADDRERELVDMLDSADKSRLQQIRRAEAAEKEIELRKLQVLNFVDAVSLFRDRYGISAIELSQLGLGTFIAGDKDKSPVCVLGSLEDAKDAIDFTMKNQATAAKFRQLKAHFQQHQQAVTVLLDELNRLGARNHVTKEDLRKIRELRDILSGLIGRSI